MANTIACVQSVQIYCSSCSCCASVDNSERGFGTPRIHSFGARIGIGIDGSKRVPIVGIDCSQAHVV